MLRKAIYPGSFDPITNGHLDILHRALSIFSEVTIVVAGSGRKNPLFTPDERVALIGEVIAALPKAGVARVVAADAARVKVDRWSGLIMDYARDHGVHAVVRGLRAASDFEYEFMMASMNKQINADVETVFMMTSQDLYFVSSSMIKELYLYGGDVAPYVPRQVLEHLARKFPRQDGSEERR
jgi:pantetheine-phosphate adenylyltransferase